MTPDTITTIRTRLLLSRREFGLALGFSDKNALRTVRGFEEGTHEPTGTALAAIKYLEAIMAALDQNTWVASSERLREALPEFMREKV